jgi:hypothetical protein
MVEIKYKISYKNFNVLIVYTLFSNFKFFLCFLPLVWHTLEAVSLCLSVYPFGSSQIWVIRYCRKNMREWEDQYEMRVHDLLPVWPSEGYLTLPILTYLCTIFLNWQMTVVSIYGYNVMFWSVHSVSKDVIKPINIATTLSTHFFGSKNIKNLFTLMHN